MTTKPQRNTEQKIRRFINSFLNSRCTKSYKNCTVQTTALTSVFYSTPSVFGIPLFSLKLIIKKQTRCLKIKIEKNTFLAYNYWVLDQLADCNDVQTVRYIIKLNKWWQFLQAEVTQCCRQMGKQQSTLSKFRQDGKSVVQPKPDNNKERTNTNEAFVTFSQKMYISVNLARGRQPSHQLPRYFAKYRSKQTKLEFNCLTTHSLLNHQYYTHHALLEQYRLQLTACVTSCEIWTQSPSLELNTASWQYGPVLQVNPGTKQKTNLTSKFTISS